MPPPSVRPPTPVCETTPTGQTSPCACAAVSSPARCEPPPTRAVRASGSTSTPRIAARSITIPSSHVERPGMLWPPQRTATTSSCSRAKRSAVTTSSAPVGLTISAGRRSIALFQTARAES